MARNKENYRIEDFAIRLSGIGWEKSLGWKAGEKSSGRMMQRQRQELAPKERA